MKTVEVATLNLTETYLKFIAFINSKDESFITRGSVLLLAILNLTMFSNTAKC